MALESSEDPDGIIQAVQTQLHEIGLSGRKESGEGWEEILFAMSSFEPFRHSKLERGGYWGIPFLDQNAPIPSGEYTTIGARPGVGKTALMTQIAVESAKRGIKTLVVSIELPLESMRARIASYISKTSVQVFKSGTYTGETIQRIGSWSEMLHNGRIQAPVAGTPWSKIEALIRYEVDRYGLQLVLIDQFDKIGRPPVGKGSSEAYAFGAVSTGIMAMAKELGIGFVLLCQLKGDAEGREPTLSDHADSDRPGKDAAVVVHLWKNKDGDLKCKLQKNRDGAWVGKRLNLDFDGAIQAFREVEPDLTVDHKSKATGDLI
jgi:replicative DNA helicase